MRPVLVFLPSSHRSCCSGCCCHAESLHHGWEKMFMNHMTSHDKTCPVRTGLKLEASLQRKSRPAVTQQHVTNNEYRLSAGVFREKWKISKNIKSIVHFYNNTSREGRRNQGDACKDTTITRKNEPPSSASTVFSGIQSNIVFHVFVFYCFVWV